MIDHEYIDIDLGIFGALFIGGLFLILMGSPYAAAVWILISFGWILVLEWQHHPDRYPDAITNAPLIASVVYVLVVDIIIVLVILVSMIW